MTRTPYYTQKMSRAEIQSAYRMRKKAAEVGLKDIAKYEEFNVFGPELEVRKFVSTLVETGGNIVTAVRKCYPKWENQTAETCYRKGMKLLEGIRAKQLIKEALDAQMVSVEGIVSKIAKIADEGAKDADKLRALELLGKFKKMFDLPEGGTTNYNLNISEDAARRLLERRTKFSIKDGGRFDGLGQDIVEAEIIESRGREGGES